MHVSLLTRQKIDIQFKSWTTDKEIGFLNNYVSQTSELEQVFQMYDFDFNDAATGACLQDVPYCTLNVTLTQNATASVDVSLLLSYVYQQQASVPEMLSAKELTVTPRLWVDAPDKSVPPKPKYYFNAVQVYRFKQVVTGQQTAILNVLYNEFASNVLVKTAQRDADTHGDLKVFYELSLTPEEQRTLAETQQNEYQALQYAQSLFDCSRTNVTQCEVFVSVYVQQKSQQTGDVVQAFNQNSVSLQFLQTQSDARNIPTIDITNQFQSVEPLVQDSFRSYVINTKAVLQDPNFLYVRVEGCFDERGQSSQPGSLCKWELCYLVSG